MKNNRIVLVCLGLIGFPIIVQGLFCLHPSCRFFVANWTAGEILTYVGTSFLGLVAFIQNENLKKANDEAQDKLLKISSEANKLSVLARIIDYELNKKKILIDNISFFEVASNAQNILTAIDLSGKVDLKALIEKESAFTESYLRLCGSLGMRYDDNEVTDSTGYLSAVRKMYVSVTNMITIIKEEQKQYVSTQKGIDTVRVKSVVEEVNKSRLEMEQCKSIYLAKKDQELNGIIYGTHSDINVLTSNDSCDYRKIVRNLTLKKP